MTKRFYHIGFGPQDLGDTLPEYVLLSGAPERSQYMAEEYCTTSRCLSRNRGLASFIGQLATGQSILFATSGMGAPSLSIVVNELFSLGFRKIIRVGTCGSIQPHIPIGDVVISQGALCRQGAALDIAPPEYPAVADPFLTVALVTAAKRERIPLHLGITASVDSFYEGQERADSSANPSLQRWLQGITQEYQQLNILNYEMEVGTLFKMACVYGFQAAGVCGVVAARNAHEDIDPYGKIEAENNAIRVAITAISS
ncbi:MAG: nucleoside phosphorylase [Cyanobacteria bacterium P01_H01_bin.15]